MEAPSRTTPYLDTLFTPPVYKTCIFHQGFSSRDSLMHTVKVTPYSYQSIMMSFLTYCYVRQCLLVLKIVLSFFKCLGFRMHFISLCVALSLHNCSSSGLLVFAHLGRISLDCTLNNNSTDSYIIYRGIYSS